MTSMTAIWHCGTRGRLSPICTGLWIDTNAPYRLTLKRASCLNYRLIWLPLPVELIGLAMERTMTMIKKIETELLAAKATLAEISAKFKGFSDAQARLSADGDLVGLARLNKEHAGLEDDLIAASDGVQALESRLAELKMKEHRPKFDAAHKTHLSAVKAEAAAVEKLLAELGRCLEACTDMQNLSDEVAATYHDARELHNRAGLDHELRWPQPDGQALTKLGNLANSLRDELMRTIRLYEDRVPQFQSLEGIRFAEQQQAEMAKNSWRWFK